MFRLYFCIQYNNFPNDVYKKNLTNEDSNVIRVHSTSIILSIFKIDILFSVFRDVLLLLSTIWHVL